jgi:prepilin-type N-terminal cleavage/methylation domain-containing protein
MAARPARSEDRLAGRAGERGFTLLELLIVVIVVSLAVTTTVVRLDGITAKSRLSATARKIGNTARWLRNQSIILDREYFIDFDLREHQWRIVEVPEDVPPGANLSEYAEPLPWNGVERGVRFEDIQFDDGKKFEEIVVLVPFTPPSGLRWSFALHLINENGERYTVMVNALTGHIDTVAGYRDIPVVTEDVFEK